MKRFNLMAIICLAAIGITSQVGVALLRARPMSVPPGPDGAVNLPYQQQDAQGNNWIVYQGGMMQQNSGQPVFSQSGMLTIDGSGISGNNQAQLDGKTGELVMENMQCGKFMVTRRILINKEDGYIRYVDIIKNSGAQAATANVMIQINLNYGVNTTAIVTDPKHKDHQIGWVAMTGINRAAVDMFAGKNAKTVPTIQYQQGNSMVQANAQLAIPAGKSVALMHVHTTTATQDQGQQFITDLKEDKLLKSIPADVRRLIVNFPRGADSIGNLEILRGDVFDVVELRGGDQMKGTLKEESYKLTTFYGAIELPKDQVIAIINVGQFRPRQLLVTSDGQIFGGKIDKETISLELSSGQVTQVPLSQITRVGYRKRAGEPEEWTMDKPMVMMRSGERVNVEMPTAPIEISTRYGLLKLDPKTIASIAFQSEDNGVHEIFLTDGSKFAGLASAAQFEMKLTGGATAQTVKFPSSSIQRLQLAGKVDDMDDSTPTLSLANEDQMVGTLAGQLKLDTTFDTLAINGPEVRRILHPVAGSSDVQVTLWDNTTLSGQLEDPSVQCLLGSGSTIDVPLALVVEYNQPMPTPSATMVEKIKATVGDLSVDDWKQRDQAQANLVKMGPSVMGVLKQLRAGAPPEAQQRIDTILKELAKQSAKPDASSPT